ncbi:hypothetical protein T484DRAFT_1887563, partial [Baffinella frigidus]
RRGWRAVGFRRCTGGCRRGSGWARSRSPSLRLRAAGRSPSPSLATLRSPRGAVARGHGVTWRGLEAHNLREARVP